MHRFTIEKKLQGLDDQLKSKVGYDFEKYLATMEFFTFTKVSKVEQPQRIKEAYLWCVLDLLGRLK